MVDSGWQSKRADSKYFREKANRKVEEEVKPFSKLGTLSPNFYDSAIFFLTNDLNSKVEIWRT